MSGPDEIDAFIAQWRDTGGSELANTQSFINGLCTLIGVAPPQGSRTDDTHNDYVLFQDYGDGATSFGRIDAYKRDCLLLEALGLAGGPNDNLADPAAVFVFRYEKTSDGKDRPIVYHVNMLKPGSYFLAQKFILENKDVIYVAGARANEPIRLLQTISQIFTPFFLIKGAVN